MAPAMATPAMPRPVADGASALLVAEERADPALEVRDARAPLALEETELAAELALEDEDEDELD